MKTTGRPFKLTIGICLFICMQNIIAQTNYANESNKFPDTVNYGIEKYDNGSMRVRINNKMIEKFYNYSSELDYTEFSWYELLRAYRNNENTFFAFWKSYAKDQEADGKSLEIYKKLRHNMEVAKQKDSLKVFADRTVDIKVNTKMIKTFYDSDSFQNYVTFNEIIISYLYDRENLMANWNTFKKSYEETMSFAEND